MATNQNVIMLDEHIPLDPVLREGDVVRLVNMEHYCEANGELEDFLEDASGIVTKVHLVFPPNHEYAPGQAAAVIVQVPTDDGWETFGPIDLSNIVRSVRESKLLRLKD